MLSNATRGALVLSLALLTVAPAVAGGFQVQEQGAKASGRGGAFTAQADDASATFYNPAAVGQLDGWNVYVGGAVLSRSDTTLEVAGGGSIDMEDVNDYAANVYVTGPLGDRYAFAVGYFIPWALRSHWFETDPVATSSLKARWDSREWNANIIAKLTQEWSVAVGFEWVRFEIDDFSSAYDFTRLEPFLLPDPPEPLAATRNYSLSGDKAGFNAALHYKGDNGYRFGLSFRSRKIIRAEGSERWQDVSEATFAGTTNVSNDAGCPPAPGLCPMGAAFTDAAGVEATFVLPATFQIGFAEEGVGKFDWEVNLLFTRWSDFNSINIEVPFGQVNGVNSGLAFIPTTDDFDQVDDFDDTFALFAGADYNINESHAVRFGLAFDQSPVEEELTRPYLPDSDRLGVTAGYGWTGFDGKIQIDAFGQFWSYSDAEPSANTLDGVVAGSYEQTSLSAGASFQYKF